MLKFLSGLVNGSEPSKSIPVLTQEMLSILMFLYGFEKLNASLIANMLSISEGIVEVNMDKLQDIGFGFIECVEQKNEVTGENFKSFCEITGEGRRYIVENILYDYKHSY